MVWHGDQRKKTVLLVIDKDQKRRESTLAPDLRINGKRLKTLDINDTCQYLGYWGTGNGDMSATREEWRQPGTGAWLRGAEERLCLRPCTHTFFLNAIFFCKNKTDTHESKEKIRAHRASSKGTRLFLTK